MCVCAGDTPISLTARTWTAAEETNAYVRSGKAEPLVNLAAMVSYVLQMSVPELQSHVWQESMETGLGSRAKRDDVLSTRASAKELALQTWRGREP